MFMESFKTYFEDIKPSVSLVLAGVFLCLFLLPSCGGSGSGSHKKSTKKEESFVQNKARLIDVPVPLGIRPVATSSDDASGTIFLSYRIEGLAGTVQKYYHQQMERLGWREFTRVNQGDPLIMTFEKPTKLCIIRVESGPGKNKTVEIVVAPKIST